MIPHSFIHRICKTALTGLSGLSGLVDGSFSWGSFPNLAFRADFNDATNLKSASAAQFTAANSESLSKTDNASLDHDQTQFTLVCWAKRDSTGTADTLIGKWGAAAATQEYRLSFNSSDQVAFDVSDGSSATTVNVAGATSTSRWYFCAGRFDTGASNSMRVVIGDDLGTALAEATSNTFSGSVPLTATSLILGADNSTNFHGGAIQDAAIFHDGLTDAQITWLYNSGSGRSYSDLVDSTDTDNPGTANLVSFWELDETGLVRMDAHGDNHLSDNNTVTTVAGYVEQASAVPDRSRAFNGTNHFFTSGAQKFRNSDAAGTFSFWFLRGSAGTHTVFEKFVDVNNRWVVYLHTDNKVYMRSTLSGTANEISGNTTISSSNVWQHVAISSSGTAWKMYINGTETGVTVTLGSNNGNWLGDHTGTCHIGARYDQNFKMSGRLDEFLFFDSQLTDTDISDLYNNNVGLLAADLVSGAVNVTSNTVPVVAYSLSSNNSISANEDFARSSNGDGDTNYLSLAATPGVTAFPISISLWVKSNAQGGSASGTMIALDDGSTDNRIAVLIRESAATPANNARISINQGGGTATTHDGSVTINNNDYKHVLATITANTISLFVDGVADGTTAHTKTFPTLSNIRLFRSAASGSGYDGRMDEVAVFDEALDVTDAGELYNNGSGLRVRDLADGTETLTSGAVPVHAWPLSHSMPDGIGEDAASTADLTETGTTTNGDGIPAGRNVWSHPGKDLVGKLFMSDSTVPSTDAAGIPAGDGLGGLVSRVIVATGNDLAQATLAKRPFRGPRALHFDGVDDFMDSDLDAEVAQPTTVILVARFNDTATSRYAFDGDDATHRHLVGLNGSDQPVMGSSDLVAGGAADIGTVQVFVARFNGASSELYRSGTQVATGNPDSDSVNGVTVGSNAFGNGQFMDGSVYEVVLNDGNLTDAEINLIGNYFADKYDIVWTDL